MVSSPLLSSFQQLRSPPTYGLKIRQAPWSTILQGAFSCASGWVSSPASIHIGVNHQVVFLSRDSKREFFLCLLQLPQAVFLQPLADARPHLPSQPGRCSSLCVTVPFVSLTHPLCSLRPFLRTPVTSLVHPDRQSPYFEAT